LKTPLFSAGVFLIVMLTSPIETFGQWKQTSGPANLGPINALAVNGTFLFAGTLSGVFLSTNSGANWNAVDSGLTSNSVYALAVRGSELFAGTSAGIFLSTNNSLSWASVDSGLKNHRVWILAIKDSNVFAGTLSGVFLSTNNGTNWIAVDSGLTNTYVMTLAVSGTSIFAGTAGGGIFLSTNNGTSWTAVNTGLTNTYIVSLAVSGANLFAGTDDFGIWLRPLANMLTSVSLRPDEKPTVFDLRQNYPNPFNPSTSIEFDLGESMNVMLTVYDVLGREVLTLVNEKKAAGVHTVTWDASGMPSGVYYYSLQAGSLRETRKLVLVK
jgi:Secretion system C-terminal sorting domain